MDSSHGAIGSLPTQGGEIGSDKSVAPVCQQVQTDVLRKRHSSGVNFQDFFSTHRLGSPDMDFFFKSSGTPQGGINRVNRIGGANNHDAMEVSQPIHQR